MLLHNIKCLHFQPNEVKYILPMTKMTLLSGASGDYIINGTKFSTEIHELPEEL